MSIRDRGFASMDPGRVKEIASMGGKAAVAKGVGHRFAKGAEAQEAAFKSVALRKKKTGVVEK